MHILIAEDDTFLQKVYMAELTKAGYSVECVDNGEIAMQKLRSGTKPDLLILDALMPKKDGFQVLEEKNRDPLLAKIPVIMLTSLEQEKDMQRAAALGVSNYFLKTNVDLEEFVTLIHGMLPAKDASSRMSKYRGAFMTDLQQCMASAKNSLGVLMKDPADADSLFNVMRLFHSVKSSSGMMGYAELSARCEGVEQRFRSIIEAKVPASVEDRCIAEETIVRIEEIIGNLV